MGYIKHHAIIVTHDTGRLEELRTWAVEHKLPCSEIVKGLSNGTESLFIAPDGSKEGWRVSDEQEALRNQFITLLKTRPSVPDFIAVSFGGDDPELADITDSNGNISY